MDNRVIHSWKKNAEEWIKVIDQKQIESRLYTNRAIENVINGLSAQKILDIGCGEGWLTRSLTKMGKKAVGIDAIETLLVNARTKGPEPFYQMSYEDIITGKHILGAPYDAAVFNFSLYQEEGLSTLLKHVGKFLRNNGKIIVQTLHPYFLFEMGYKYKSQTISDSWKGLPGNFSDGHEWYARTFEDWVSVISESGMRIEGLREILDKEKPISLILVLSQTAH